MALTVTLQVRHELGTPWVLDASWVREIRLPVHTEVEVRFEGRVGRYDRSRYLHLHHDTLVTTTIATVLDIN